MTPIRPSLLIVDDNPADVDLMTIALEEAGLDVAVSSLSDGRAAIEHLSRIAPHRSGWPDCVVLDLNMPITNGHEVLAHIAADERLRGLPVVVLTTSNAPSDRERCLAGGASDYVVKPRRFADFAPIIARLRSLLGDGPRPS